VILAGLTLAGLACRDDQFITDQEAPPTVPYVGITTTDNIGGIISSDADDWKPIQGLQVHPAYPNPTHALESFTLDFRTFSTDSVRITVNRSPDVVYTVVLDERIIARRYLIGPSVALLNPGIYRVYFSIIRPDTTIVTYGDVEIIP